MDEPPIIRRQEHGIKSVSLTASIPGELAGRLRQRARERGVTVSSLVTAALARYLAAAPDDDDDQEEAA